MKKHYCPFFLNENENLTKLNCEACTINFPSREARRNFVYPLCGSLGGFKDCRIYKMLSIEERGGKK